MAELEQKRHERFCREYVIDYNGTKAAIRAGYKEKNARVQASALLTNPNILSRVRELQQEQVERLAVTQDYVVLQLIDTYNCCREPNPVMQYDRGTGEWVKTGTWQFDSKGALRALELLGKHLGLFDGKGAQKHTGENNLLSAIRDTEEIDTDDLPEAE